MTWTDPIVIVLAVGLTAIVLILVIALLPQTPAFDRIVKGVTTDPELVGLMRGLLIYVLPSVFALVAAYIADWRDPRLLGIAPIALGFLRWLESRMDKALKPQQNDINPPPVAGGGEIPS